MKQALTSEMILEFTERKRAFQQTFGNPPGQDVMKFLTLFCHVRKTTFVFGDRDLSLILEGQRRVFLLIQDYLDSTPEELIRKYTEPE